MNVSDVGVVTSEVESHLSVKALFLDRDGVINVDHGYVHTIEATEWMPGIFEVCSAAQNAGYRCVVVTNQAGIARGFYTEAAFREYSRWMHSEFEKRGVHVQATYYCPHHPTAGVGDLRRDCNCRKPQPGMLLAAQNDWGFDLERSIMVGNQRSDIEAALSASVGRAFWLGASTGDTASLDERVHPLSSLWELIDVFRREMTV